MRFQISHVIFGVWTTLKYEKKFLSQVIASKNAVAFRRAAGELNEGCWGRSTLLFCISACNNYVVHAGLAHSEGLSGGRFCCAFFCSNLCGGKGKGKILSGFIVLPVHFLLVQKTNQKRTLFIRNFCCAEPTLKLRVTAFLISKLLRAYS